MIEHRVRLAPFQPETVWTLEAGDLVQRRGAKERRWPLSTLRSLRLVTVPRGAALLTFARGSAALGSLSYAGPGRYEDRTASFHAFVRALCEETVGSRARFLTGAPQVYAGVIWSMALIGAGALALLLASLSAGATDLALALAARMVFVLILLGAALPWIDKRAGTFDPLDPPLAR